MSDGRELVEAYLEGGLDAEDGARLVAWLREDPEHVRELITAARLHSELRSAVRARVARASSAVRREVGSDPRLAPRTAARRSPWKPLLPWMGAAAAAALIVVVALLAVRARHAADSGRLVEVVAIASGDGLPPRLEPSGGQPASLEVGARARSGDRIVTRSATVTIRSLREATSFVLSPGASVALAAAADGSALQVSLDEGTLRAAVAKQAPGTRLVLLTPQARVEVVGTEFTLSVEATATRLAVSEGVVRFTRLADGTVEQVAAGGRAATYAAAPVASPFARWKHGPSADPTAFPIGVWAQDPAFAPRYREAGIGCYVALPAGDLDQQLAALRAAGMSVVCDPSDAALAHAADATIVGWLGPVRPDDAPDAVGGAGGADTISTIGAGKHTPTPPATVLARYRELAARDPSRPVLLCLGQGVAWDGWYGRGTRTGHPGDYPEYLEACDIAAVGIDPIGQRAIRGQLWQVGAGVERLRRWQPSKPAWCVISCGHPASAPDLTAAQLRSEVWIALIHGAGGIVYSSAPAEGVRPAVAPAAPAISDDAGLMAAITAIDQRIAELAAVLARASLPAVAVSSSASDVPVATMLKGAGARRYLFAAAMRGGATSATFSVPDLHAGEAITVLDEDRRIVAEDGRFTDAFAGFGVHLYLIGPAAAETKP